MISTPSAPRAPRRARLVRRVAVLGAALALLAPTGAEAAERTYEDRRGDITTYQAPPPGTNPAKSDGIDIYRVSINRRDGSTTVRVRLRDVVSYSRTARNYQRVEVYATFRRPGATQDTTQVSQAQFGSIRRVDCRAADSSLSVSGNVAVFTYPRICFGGARTARFSFRSELVDSGKVLRRDGFYVVSGV